MANDLIFGMAGSGGDGVVSAGESLLAAVSSAGYHALMTKSFGPQIRGGESSCRVRVRTDRVQNPGGELDVAVALNWDDFFKFGAELPLAEHTVLLHEEEAGPPPATLAPSSQRSTVGADTPASLRAPIRRSIRATSSASCSRASRSAASSAIATASPSGWSPAGVGHAPPSIRA